MSVSIVTQAISFAEDQWMVLKPHMHTDPTCFYVGLPREVI